MQLLYFSLQNMTHRCRHVMKMHHRPHQQPRLVPEHLLLLFAGFTSRAFRPECQIAAVLTRCGLCFYTTCFTCTKCKALKTASYCNCVLQYTERLSQPKVEQMEVSAC